MRRFLIFALLYPLLVNVIFMVISVALLGRFFLSIILHTLGWGLATALVPAIALAFVDWFLAARLRLTPRVVSTALVGYAIALAVALTAWDRSIWFETLIFPLAGAVPAAICSWLSDEKQSGAKAA
jgi:hypothetical protein